MKQYFTRVILPSALLVGTLDITAATIQYYMRTGKDPLNVPRFVASGVFGQQAFSGGTPMAAWGLLFHYLIAFSFSVFFFWIYRKWAFLAKYRILTGILYGIFIWMVMNLVVLPLSNTPPLSLNIGKAAEAASILICMIGLPLSFIAARNRPAGRNL
mgnify:CR=1 FL=1